MGNPELASSKVLSATAMDFSEKGIVRVVLFLCSVCSILTKTYIWMHLEIRECEESPSTLGEEKIDVQPWGNGSRRPILLARPPRGFNASQTGQSPSAG